MKIRFKNNTIRYRLDQIDIENIKSQGYCHEKITIGANILVFSLKKIEKQTNSILLSPFLVEAGVKSAEMTNLIEGSEVSLAYAVPNKDGTEVKILIEKDFKCLVPRGDDDKHAFENPLEGKASC